MSLWPGDEDASEGKGSSDVIPRNGATYVREKVGSAISLDGVDDIIEVGDPSKLYWDLGLALQA